MRALSQRSATWLASRARSGHQQAVSWHHPRSHRFFTSQVLYTSDPSQWQDHPEVLKYGDSLPDQATNPAAFIRAAEALRAKSSLPLDLRASAGQALASQIGKEALSLYKRFNEQRSSDAAWPVVAHNELMKAIGRASALYAQVIKESSDSQLMKDLVPICPPWPQMLGSLEIAAAELKKVEVAVQLIEVRWLRVQIERARAVAHAAKNGSSAREAVEKLRAVELFKADEQELLRRAIGIAENIIAACKEETSEDLEKLHAQGQVILMVQLKELALACACESQSEEAAKHILRALGVRPVLKGAMGADDADGLSEAAQAVWEHVAKSATSGQSQQALQLSTELGAALVEFNSKMQ